MSGAESYFTRNCEHQSENGACRRTKVALRSAERPTLCIERTSQKVAALQHHVIRCYPRGQLLAAEHDKRWATRR